VISWDGSVGSGDQLKGEERAIEAHRVATREASIGAQLSPNISMKMKKCLIDRGNTHTSMFI
jgi:hypothetical protein